MIQRKGGGQGSEGLPDGMSCAGIFGSECTKTVVMEHHRMNGSSEVLTCPPANLRASHKACRNFVRDGHQRWLSGLQDQKSKKTAMDLSSNSGNENPVRR